MDEELNIEVIDTRETALVLVVRRDGRVEITCNYRQNGEPDYAWVAQVLRRIADAEESRA